MNIVLKNPKWQEADQFATYKVQPRSWTRDNKNKSRELQVQHFNPSAKLKDVQPHFHTSNVQTGLKKHISLSQTTEQPVF